MQAFDLAAIRQKLLAHPATTLPASAAPARAAVAAILRQPDGAPEVLLIRRAERAGDPWSGHMAFPGGRAELREDDLATAIRETREEIGLDLATHGELLGRLDDLPAIARGKPAGLVIAPFVFALDGDPALSPNHEVAEVLWAKLADLTAAGAATTIDYPYEGRTLTLPATLVEGRIVWGLTHRMLEALFDVVRR